ncbi:hypothetical protein K470DRAFT_216975 [Piedraia hortae CBS 480.64]|uniref:Spindle pole body component n=1 Tax=Piedraia hortae CBS 480.64 TaxID=1314780 RepID=A0A6A7C0K4_9PEZI|nr:hypothetical protein K470DRAFT_216975 [Piedraia hortae CBS 480.64]
MSTNTRQTTKTTRKTTTTVVRKAQKPHPQASPVPEAPGWTPKATLLSPTPSAPLATRISQPPLARNAKSLKGISLDQQEKLILSDLLMVLMNFEGEYIVYSDAFNPTDHVNRFTGPAFKTPAGLDPSIGHLIQPLLSLASQYSALEVYTDTLSSEEYGSVNHALCAAIRKILKDYLILITQLEHQYLTNKSFTLNQMSLHLKPTAHTLRILYSLTQEILKENSLLGDLAEDVDDSEDFENIFKLIQQGRDASLPGKKSCKGGAVLRLLTHRLQSSAGDPVSTKLLSDLLQQSSIPYMRMLNEWLHHGNVVDPHAEFLIKEQKSIKREGLQQDYTDEYWEKRYTLRKEAVPPQLEAVKERVLLAGKYLNVVRECGGIAATNTDGEASNTNNFTSNRSLISNVNSAYTFANRSLMHLLLTTHQLPARLRSLKHYFLLDRSDFFSYFLDLSASELKKPSRSANESKLQSLLEIVLRQPGSVAAEDPYKEDVKVAMADSGLMVWLMRIVTVQGIMEGEQGNTTTAVNTASNNPTEKEISGYEALTLDYAVPFPLSLIISRNTLTRYQVLFRYLLSLRHLETQLTHAWTEHCMAGPWVRSARIPTRGSISTPPRSLETWKRKAWCLRARMLCFVQQLLYYCTSEVIEPHWNRFMERLQSEKTVDELMQDHVDFLATCLKECMLTNHKLLRINSKVLQTCSMFASYTSSLSRYLAALETDDSSQPEKISKLFTILAQYEEHFSRHLKILLDALNYLAATETAVFLGLCARLSMAEEEGGKRGGI